MPGSRQRLLRRFVLLVLVLFPSEAAGQGRVPQPRALTEALLRVNLPREAGPAPLRGGRFPLPFAVDWHHGQFRSVRPGLSISVYGHGPSRRAYRSVSLEVQTSGRDRLEEDIAAMREVITGIGLPEAVATVSGTMLRRARQRADSMLANGWFPANLAEVEEIAGMHMRLEGTFYSGYANLILQLTDADAPETEWPAPREVEALQPWGRRIVIGVTDIEHRLAPAVFDLRCRPAGRHAFRCSYVITSPEWRGPNPPGVCYTDVFRRGADGAWSMDGVPPR